MSIKIMNACWDLEIPNSRKLVLISLADQANDDGICWPSMRHTARRCSVSQRAVRRSVEWLEEKGYVKRISRPGHSNNYQLPTPDSSVLPSFHEMGHQRPTPRTVVSAHPGHYCPPESSSNHQRNKERGFSKKEDEENARRWDTQAAPAIHRLAAAIRAK